MTDVQTFATRLKQRFEGLLTDCIVAYGQITLELLPEHLLEVCQALRDEEEFSFEQLIDVCGVDYLAYGLADWETEETTTTGFSRGVSLGIYREEVEEVDARFASVYHLLSLKYNRRLRLRCWINTDPPRVDSVVHIWNSANWFEREAFDLYGILYVGHPDLRRILTDYGFIGHPFRKDFPLVGNVEVRYDPEQQRVVYQPVTIKNRVLVPKVIREATRYPKKELKTESEKSSD